MSLERSFKLTEFPAQILMVQSSDPDAREEWTVWNAMHVMAALWDAGYSLDRWEASLRISSWSCTTIEMDVNSDCRRSFSAPSFMIWYSTVAYHRVENDEKRQRLDSDHVR
jgi:hypothetical protein